jgi:hypothetical protein
MKLNLDNLKQHGYDWWVLILQTTKGINMKKCVRQIINFWLDWYRAGLEVFLVCVFSLLPLGGFVLFDVMKSGQSPSKSYLEAVSGGELFLLAISFAASAWLIASDTLPWQKQRPRSMFYVNIFAVILYVICVLFSVTQRLGIYYDNKDAVIDISKYTFIAANIVLLLACKIRNKGLPSLSENDLKADEHMLSDNFLKRIGGN